MGFIQSRFQTIRNDRMLAVSFLVAAAEAACHFFEINEGGFQIAELIRAVFCVSYILVAFLICRWNAIYYAFSVLALGILYFNKYTNYTSFFIIALTVQKMPRLKIPLFLAYAVDVLVCLFVGHRMAHHAVIHVINCAWIYAMLNLDFKKQEFLELTADERTLLDEWVTVGDLKAVECFSRKTVFDKLKAARERNGIADNKILKARYIRETKVLPE